MKKITLKVAFIIVVSVVGALLILLVPYICKKYQNNTMLPIQYDELLEKIEQREEFVLLISKDGCPDCDKLKEEIHKEHTSERAMYIFEYDKNRTETLISELEAIFPNFVAVPYLCYVNDGVPEAYYGEMDPNSIFEWICAEH